MNNNLKRFLSSVLAFVMLLSCMMVVNVSNVFAATPPTSDSYDYLWTSATPGEVISVSGAGNSSSISATVNFSDGTVVDSSLKGTKIDKNGTFTVTLADTVKTSGILTIYAVVNTSSGNYDSTVSTSSSGATIQEGTGTLYRGGYSEQKSPVIVNVTGAGTYTFSLVSEKESRIAYVTFKADGSSSESTTTATTTEATTATTTETTTATVTEEESSETTTVATADYSYTIQGTEKGYNDGTLKFDGSANSNGYVQGKTFSLTTSGKATITLKLASSGSGTRSISVANSSSESAGTIAIPQNSGTAEYTISLDAADTYTFTCTSNFNLYSVSIKYDSTTPVEPTETYTVSVNVTDGTNAVSGATVKLDDTTLAESSTAGTYTATAITAGTVFTGLTVTATGYTDYTDTTERTINADTTIPVTLTATPTADPITVTVYDSSSREKIKGVVYYWTTTDGGSTTNEYKLVNSNAVIHVTEIANGTEAYLPTYSSGTDATNTPQSDMKDVLASATPKLYVTSEGYMGAEVALPTSGNVNVLLTPLAEVNIATAGVYKVTANDIIAALLTSDANYAYQNPYINTAKVNGFTLSAEVNNTDQIFKIMQKVNTRNEYADKNNTARNLIQATDGCKIVYKPTVAGKLYITAASTSKDATGRGYTLDNVDNGTVSLTSTTAVLNTFDLTANTTYTMTVAGGINISSIEFVPDEVTKYSLTFTDDANGGKATVTVGDTTLTSGTEYSFAENSEVKISVTPDTGKKATVKVNGTIVALADDNTYSFALSGDNTSIEVTYADETAAEEVNTLTPIAIGETVDFSKETLKAQNTSLTSDKKAEYYADAVSGGGKTSVIKLKANDSTNYIKFVPAEDGNIAINFNSNPITVTGSDGSVVTLARATDGASNDVTRTMAVKAGVTYTITATSSGNAYVNSISLLASTVVAGNNIASVYDKEDLTNNTAVLSAYGVTGTPEKAVRIIGQLKDITENNAADVDGAGVVILDCTIAEWKTSGLAESHIKGTLSVNKVYADVYNSADFDSSKVIDDTYTGNVKGLSELNSYFDLLVYADTATDFDGKAACAFTLVGDTKEYYNSNAELSGIDF